MKSMASAAPSHFLYDCACAIMVLLVALLTCFVVDRLVKIYWEQEAIRRDRRAEHRRVNRRENK